MIYLGDYFELSFCQLVYLDYPCCFGVLAAEKEAGGLGDPFYLVGSEVDVAAQVLDHLRGVCCVHF